MVEYKSGLSLRNNVHNTNRLSKQLVESIVKLKAKRKTQGPETPFPH